MPAAPPEALPSQSAAGEEQTEALTAKRHPHSDPLALTGNGVKVLLA